MCSAVFFSRWHIIPPWNTNFNFYIIIEIYTPNLEWKCSVLLCEWWHGILSGTPFSNTDHWTLKHIEVITPNNIILNINNHPWVYFVELDFYLELSNRSEIWHALRQHCCRCACQIAKRYNNLKYQSRDFETSRDLMIRLLFGYWDGAQDSLSMP